MRSHKSKLNYFIQFNESKFIRITTTMPTFSWTYNDLTSDAWLSCFGMKIVQGTGDTGCLSNHPHCQNLSHFPIIRLRKPLTVIS